MESSPPAPLSVSTHAYEYTASRVSLSQVLAHIRFFDGSMSAIRSELLFIGDTGLGCRFAMHICDV